MASVDVSVEALQENKIHEVTYDGREIYVHPLSMSENLTKLAHKIDFTKDEADGEGTVSEAETEEEEKEAAKDKAKIQASLWPWDSVRNKLKSALTECSVLLDVLQVAKDKKYMVLDPVHQEPPEQRNGVQLLAKKRSLASAATILQGGAERLRRSQEQLSKKTTPDFHHELIRLRQNWRLKKMGSVILGDLSYRSAGSRFYQNGTFEVRKSEEEAKDSSEPTTTAKSTLQVTVPTELEGVAYIQVTIKSIPDSLELATAELTLPGTVGGPVPPVDPLHWQQKLENAQNVIFCKEVFAQLAREATQMQSKIPHLVVGNQILSHLFPGLQLSIALCHITGKDKAKSPRGAAKQDQHHVLEHSVHQLLRELHMKNAFHPMPHPVTGLLGMSKKRRLAGPHAFSRTELVDIKQSETLLEQIIKQAQHIIIRKRTIDVIDEVATQVKDPVMTAHWSNLSSAIESMIKVHITATGYESVRTPFSIHLAVDQLRAIVKDGKVLQLSREQQQLKDFLLSQVSAHHINTMMHIGKWMGWHMLSINLHSGVGHMEQIGNAHTIMLASPKGDRVLSVKSGPQSGVKVHMQRCPAPETTVKYNGVVTDAKWLNLGGAFEEVRLDRMEGRNFANKMEIFMACTAANT